jgi:hypothetical protein
MSRSTMTGSARSVDMSRKRLSDAAYAHMEQVIAYVKDPAQAPHRNPPRAPNEEVAREVFQITHGILAVLLDRLMTGGVHVEKPDPLAVLGACDLADMALEGSLTEDKMDEVLRMYGWKGDL